MAKVPAVGIAAAGLYMQNWLYKDACADILCVLSLLLSHGP